MGVIVARGEHSAGDDHPHGIDEHVDVAVPGGTLRISWDGTGEVYLEGPAAFVFASRWEDTP